MKSLKPKTRVILSPFATKVDDTLLSEVIKEKTDRFTWREIVEHGFRIFLQEREEEKKLLGKKQAHEEES